jgi:hypothetical protein
MGNRKMEITNCYGIIPESAFSKEKSHEHKSPKAMAVTESDVITLGKRHQAGFIHLVNPVS